MRVGGLLVLVADGQQGFFVEVAAHQLQSDGKSAGSEPTGDRHRRDARQVG